MKDRIGGYELWFDTFGKGRPILALHGGMGLDSGYLRNTLEPLASDAKIVVYDQFGNGASERPALWDFGLDKWADDAVAVADHLKLERPILLGHSYGGYVAQTTVLRHPGRFSALVLVSTAPALDYAPEVVANAEARGTAEQIELAKRVFTTPVADDAEFERLWPRILPLYFHRPEPALVQAACAARYSAAALNHGMGLLATFDTRARLREIALPTLLVGGDDDWITPAQRTVERLHTGIRDSKLAVIPECGHFPMIERPARFLDEVRGFVATH
jgi:proline iminopeptidase